MSAEGNARIVVCGHLCLDIIPRFPPGQGQDYFRPGRLSIVDAAVTATGGAVSNVGQSLHKLGFPVRLVGKVGKDPFGDIVIQGITRTSPDLGRYIVAVRGETTSYSVVINPPGVDRVFFHCPGANDTFTDADVSDDVLEGATLFHFGYPPIMKGIWSDGGARLLRLLARARRAGAITSLDMSLPDPASASGKVDWQAFLDTVLPAVDLFVPSIEELLFMSNRALFDALTAGGGGGEAIIREITLEQTEALARKAVSAGVSAVLIKMGDRGAYLKTSLKGVGALPEWRSRELYTPVFQVPQVGGTTGAGDATIAGFLASVSRALEPEEALTMAVAVGACCVESPDATSGVRPWDETRARVRSGWKRCDTRVSEPGWRLLEPGVWAGPLDAKGRGQGLRL
ncbi:MAG TPA: carbohydrate kinase family protein [Spirochaetia bacterium]|nr:carbohydrate kinase family protein [Spirochaetia bacterium]